MRRVSFCITVPVVLLLLPCVIEADTVGEPYTFFRRFAGLNEEQIAAIRSGKAVAKVVESPSPDEVYVFGSVHVEATPESSTSSLPLTSTRCASSPANLAIQCFSDPPQLSDLDWERVETGRAYRIEREHRAQGGRRQDPFFTRAGPRDDKTKAGIAALAR